MITNIVEFMEALRDQRMIHGRPAKEFIWSKKYNRPVPKLRSVK